MAVTQPSREATVYESTASGLPLLRPYFIDLWARRRLIWHLARTDLKAEHYDSAIGQVWVILDPLLLAAGVLPVANGGEAGRWSGRPLGAHRPHRLGGVLLHVREQRHDGRRAVDPERARAHPERVVPARRAPVGGDRQVGVRFPSDAGRVPRPPAILGQPFGISLAFIPAIIAILVVMNMGLALLFSPLMVFFRDTGGFLPYVNRIWLYVTPALYTVATIPKNLVVYLRWNPLYPSFAALEQIFAAQRPSKVYLLAAAAWAVGFFLLGAIVFLARERDFAVRL